MDLCGLAEVRGRLLSGSHDEAAELGVILDMGWLFAPAERRFWHDSFGNGIVSRLPLTYWARLPMPRSADASAYRNFLFARVAVPSAAGGARGR